MKVVLFILNTLFPLCVMSTKAPFRIERTFPAKVNEAFELKCILKDGDEKLKDCRFESPDNRVLVLNLNTLEVSLSNDPSILKGYSGVKDPLYKTCGLKIDSLTQNELGQWKCLLNSKEISAPYTYGLLNALESGYVSDVRLPTSISPTSYDITLIPNLLEKNSSSIDGKVLINLTVSTLTKAIFLHSKNIHVSSVSLGALAFESFGYDYERDFLIINLLSELKASTQHLLQIEFFSVLNDDLKGFYKSFYGENQILAVSQFEAISARLAFPCFDEPDKKATFTIRLGRPSNMISASNMPLAFTDCSLPAIPGYCLDSFEKSVVMSTYLVAFLIADVRHLYNEQDSNFGIFVQYSQEPKVKLALQNVKYILDYFNDYFDSPYPLPKMDLVSVPDFSAGAMENWGLVTFRESLLLYSEEENSITDKENILEVLAHELAHQWFGNLVTMSWWDDLWLNEGFASYAEYIGVNAVSPDFLSLDRFINKALQPVLYDDSSKNTKAISGTVNNPDYENTFTSITYKKGASLIRMMESFLTKDVFKKGIQTYIQRKKYSNANRNDLWKILQEVALANNSFPKDMDLSSIMESWTSQPGYPVVSLTMSQNDNTSFEVSQKRFYLNWEIEEEGKEAKSLWTIPLSWKTLDGSSKGLFWLSKDSDNLTLNSDSLFLLNFESEGFFRVNYEEDHWNQIIQVLQTNHSSINEINRASLIDDAFNLAAGNQLNYTIPLHLIRYLVNERHIIPLSSALVHLNRIRQKLFNPSSYNYCVTFVSRLIRQTAVELGDIESNITENSPIQRSLRILLLNNLIKLYDSSSLQSAKDVFSSWKNTGINRIHPDFRRDVYGAVITVGTDDDWIFLHRQYFSASSVNEKLRILNGLSSSRNKSYILQVLNMTTNTQIRFQDIRYAYSSVGSTSIGRLVMTHWLYNEYSSLKEYFTPTKFPGVFLSIVRPLLSESENQDDLDTLNAFIDKNSDDLEYIKSELEDLKDEASLNIQWINTYSEEVGAFFEKYGQNINHGTQIRGIFFLTFLSPIILSFYCLY